jgi:hypothetical protein
MDCNGTSLSPSDYVWLFYKTNDPSLKYVIYDFSGKNPFYSNSFNVLFQASGYTISSLLYIYNVNPSYTQYTFNCQCNIYKGCASTPTKPSTTAVISILTSINNSALIFSFWTNFSILIFY